MNVDLLRTARVAAVGLDTTTGRPPLIVEATVNHVSGGVITAGPFSYWAAPDAPLHEVRLAAWSNVRLAPPWSEVAERFTEAIGDRILAVHDRDRLDILRRHLPDWHPAGVILTRELAEHAWPGLSDYSLTPLNPAHPLRHGAAVEAHAVALLLGTLLHAVTHPVPRPRNLDTSVRHG